MFMVGSATKICPILICTYPFAMWLCSFFPQQVDGISPHPDSELSLPLAWTNRMWWKWWKCGRNDLKKPFSNYTCPLAVLHWDAMRRRPDCRSMKDHMAKLSWLKPSRSISQQPLNTPRHVSKTISDHPPKSCCQLTGCTSVTWDETRKELYSCVQPKLPTHRIMVT